MPRSFRSVTEQSLHYFIRPHLGRPAAAIHSPAAWRGEDLRHREEAWIARLTPAQIRELEAALDTARATRKPTIDLQASDFPLPTLAAPLRGWVHNVQHGLGVQVIRGLPVDRWSVDDCERVFFCLGQHMGIPGAQNRFEEILGHVRDEGLSYDDPAVRGYRTTAHLSYHCDAADVVGLLCVRPALSGGRSRFVSSVTVWNQLHATRPDLAQRLFEPLQLDTRGDGGLNYFPIAPCRYSLGTLRTFYHADYFRTFERHPGARPLTRHERELLDRYDEIASRPELYLEMDFEPGDIQLLSNHTLLHSRTAYIDAQQPERKRHLLRLWLSLPFRPSLVELPSLAAESLRLLRGLAVGRLRDRQRRAPTTG